MQTTFLLELLKTGNSYWAITSLLGVVHPLHTTWGTGWTTTAAKMHALRMLWYSCTKEVLYKFFKPPCFYSSLMGRKEKVRINHTFRFFQFLASGVTQWPILGPIIWNIFINNFLTWSKTSELHHCAYSAEAIENKKKKKTNSGRIRMFRLF